MGLDTRRHVTGHWGESKDEGGADFRVVESFKAHALPAELYE